jgi:hypothetical protein
MGILLQMWVLRNRNRFTSVSRNANSLAFLSISANCREVCHIAVCALTRLHSKGSKLNPCHSLDDLGKAYAKMTLWKSYPVCEIRKPILLATVIVTKELVKSPERSLMKTAGKLSVCFGISSVL